MRKFCERCFNKMSNNWAKRHQYDPKCRLDVKKMVFPCQVPIFDPDYEGTPRMRIWNCETERPEYYSMKDYNMKRRQGLLP